MNKEFNKTESEQKNALYAGIWKIASKLRGELRPDEFKEYVLGILFYRFISEHITNYFNQNEWEVGNIDFNYADISDEEAEKYFREDSVTEKGFFILPSQLFANVVKNASSNENLNVDLLKTLETIEKSALGTMAEGSFSGLFLDIYEKSSKLGDTVKAKNKVLSDLLESIEGIEFESFEKTNIDIFGDVYEYLIYMYAKNAGRSKGEFFTPQTVSKLLARIATHGMTEINKVYDPACGSGSLLLQVAKVFDINKIQYGFYGQDINSLTYNLCRMNMLLHNVNFSKFSIKKGDTLTDPQHLADREFDVIVSNPPYSLEWEGNKNPILINDERFSPAGVLAPNSKADFAFVMHSLNHLSNKGKGAIVLFPGVFHRTGAEQQIRRYLINNNYVNAVIQLPDNLFYGTSIATCILVIEKNRTDEHVLFIDASEEFKKETNQNILSDNNIEKIMESFINREDIDHFAKKVHLSEIEKNDFNLSVSTYVEKEDKREVVDIKVLNQEIKQTVSRIDELRSSINEIIKEIENE